MAESPQVFMGTIKSFNRKSYSHRAPTESGPTHGLNMDESQTDLTYTSTESQALIGTVAVSLLTLIIVPTPVACT